LEPPPSNLHLQSVIDNWSLIINYHY
jgi:hypothetical protein